MIAFDNLYIYQKPDKPEDDRGLPTYEWWKQYENVMKTRCFWLHTDSHYVYGNSLATEFTWNDGNILKDVQKFLKQGKQVVHHIELPRVLLAEVPCVNEKNAYLTVPLNFCELHKKRLWGGINVEQAEKEYIHKQGDELWLKVEPVQTLKGVDFMNPYVFHMLLCTHPNLPVDVNRQEVKDLLYDHRNMKEQNFKLKKIAINGKEVLCMKITMSQVTHINENIKCRQKPPSSSFEIIKPSLELLLKYGFDHLPEVKRDLFIILHTFPFQGDKKSDSDQIFIDSLEFRNHTKK